MAESGATPRLSGVVVAWRSPETVRRSIAAWPDDPRFELIVVDNGGSTVPPSRRARLLDPGRNLGFAGGANLGIAAAAAPRVLLLNPDALPRPGALDELLAGFDRHPDAAGLCPRLVGGDGRGQWRWQLRRLPTAGGLLVHAAGGPPPGHLGDEPQEGAPVEQPAAAALALHRDRLDRLGGLDPRFHPAWFEDVDLARRLREAGGEILYWPRAEFVHRGGAALDHLDGATFLAAYHGNLLRYLAKHHGRAAAATGRALLVPGTLLRLLALPLRRPGWASSRAAAVRPLLRHLAATLTTRLAGAHPRGGPRNPG